MNKFIQKIIALSMIVLLSSGLLFGAINPFSISSLAGGLMEYVLDGPAESRQTGLESPWSRSDISQRVRIEHIPAANILYLPVSGNYDKHPQVLGQLVGYAENNFITTGTCFGIYPVDPDSVGVSFARVPQTADIERSEVGGNEKKLEWAVAIRVIPGNPAMAMRPKVADSHDPFSIGATEVDLQSSLSSFKRVKAPFELKRLPAITALVLETDVRRSAQDGLALNAWLIANGYVQVGPTRMELAMHSKDAATVETKILIPVEKRKSGLRVITDL